MAKEGLIVGSGVQDGFDADAFNLVWKIPQKKTEEQISQKEKISLLTA